MKVLVISYYWPPAGGPGVQRWLKFCTYLPEFGIEPIVYIPENPNYPILDEGLLAELPSDIKIIKRPIWEPYFLGSLFGKKSTKTLSRGIIDQKPSLLKRMMLFLRGNLFIPDARKAWVKPSVKYLQKYLEQNPVDVIITTGPPHSLHLIGMKLKSLTATPWLADFRDPWTTIGYHKQLRLLARSAKKHKRLEAEVLNSADMVLVTSPSTKMEFQAITKQPIEVITNGFDNRNKPAQLPELDKKFSIAHIGSLLVKRNPRTLWKILQRMCMEVEGFKDDLHLVFAGVVAEEVKESLSHRELLEYTEFKGYVDHKEAINLQHQSQLLLLLEIDSKDTRAILPGKLYEYMMAERPILAVGPDGSDMAQILKESGSGSFFAHEDVDAIRRQLIESYKAFKAGNLNVVDTRIDQFERRALSEKLATILKSETLSRRGTP